MLIETYKKNQKFEETQRKSLIHLIAEYYNDIGINLELPATYDIEKEIIAKFPSEQLVRHTTILFFFETFVTFLILLQEFYRTSKRGRIYNKYCNLKYQLIKEACSSTTTTTTELLTQTTELKSNLGKLCFAE